jgi:hypothetical protein
MPQLSFSKDNIGKPAPKWFRKLEMGVCMILIPAAVLILQGSGLDDKLSTRIQLYLSVGVAALFKFMGIMLANGEEYTVPKPEN